MTAAPPDQWTHRFKAGSLLFAGLGDAAAGRVTPRQQAGRQIGDYPKLGSKPGGERPILTRCRRILFTSSGSVITARIPIGEPHRGQVRGSTSYTSAMSLAHVERACLPETEEGDGSTEGAAASGACARSAFHPAGASRATCGISSHLPLVREAYRCVAANVLRSTRGDVLCDFEEETREAEGFGLAPEEPGVGGVGDQGSLAVLLDAHPLQREGWPGDVLGEGFSGLRRAGGQMNAAVEAESGVPPVAKAGGEPGADEIFL